MCYHDSMARIMVKGYFALRFSVLERDKFTCQYCGQSAPDARLEVDHINPVSNGGNDNEDNLITSCYACNRGKRERLIVRRHSRISEFSPTHHDIYAYLLDNGPASASVIAKAISRPRPKVSHILINSPSFESLPRKGRDVPYKALPPG